MTGKKRPDKEKPSVKPPVPPLKKPDCVLIQVDDRPFAFVVKTIDAERTDVYSMGRIDADESWQLNWRRWRYIGSRPDMSQAVALALDAAGWSDFWLRRMPLLDSTVEREG